MSTFRRMKPVPVSKGKEIQGGVGFLGCFFIQHKSLQKHSPLNILSQPNVDEKTILYKLMKSRNNFTLNSKISIHVS